MIVKAESAQAGMSEIVAAHGEAAEAVRREKAGPDAGTGFLGVRRRRRKPQSGRYGAQIWHPSRKNNVWLGTFGSAEDAAKAYDAAAVELRGAAAKTNFKCPAAVEAAGRRKKLFENVYKYYYKRRKDNRAGRNDGKTYGSAGAAYPVATAVVAPGMVGPSAVQSLPEPPSAGATAGMATPVVGGNLSFSASNTEEEEEEEEDMGERGKRKKTSEDGAAADAGSEKMMRFFGGLMKQAMERQEAIHHRFVEAMEKREQDCMIREEALRRQEMARLAREQEILAQERPMAAARNASVLSLIQKITGQTIPMPSIPPPSQTHATTIAYAAAVPPSSQPPPSMQPQVSQPHKSPAAETMKPKQQQALVVHQSSTDIVMKPAETPHDASGYNGSGGGGGGRAASSNWQMAEMHALIQLQCERDMRWKGPAWEKISAGMRRMGYSRSAKQCREKWWRMKNRFNKMKESNKERPEDTKACFYFPQIEAFYRNKAALGSHAGAGGAPAEHANADPRDRIEALTVAAPISQMAPQPHSLPPVDKNGVTSNDGNGHAVGGVSGGTQMQESNGGSVAGNRFVFSEAGKLETNVHSPTPPSQTDATTIAYAAAVPPSSQPPPSMQPQVPQPHKSPAAETMKPKQQQALVVHQSSTDIVMKPAETPHDASGYNGSGGGGGGRAASSNWLMAEMHALIQLQCERDMRWKGPAWEKISAGMRRMGYSRSANQCREKWWRMKNRFNKMKESNKKRPEDTKACLYFPQLEAFYRNKAALGLGSHAGAGGAAAEHANADPRDRVEAFTVAAPISQMAPQPHSLSPVDKNGVTSNDGNRHAVGGVSGGTQMQESSGGSVAGNRFVFSEAGTATKLETNVHSPVATGGGTYMWRPAPIADDIDPEHVQEIGLKQAPVAAIRRTPAARSDSRSGFRGVRLYSGKHYLARIREPGRPTTRLQLGMFDNVEEAARAYDAAALRLYGASAKTNFEQPPEPAEWQQFEEFLKKIDGLQ